MAGRKRRKPFQSTEPDEKPPASPTNGTPDGPENGSGSDPESTDTDLPDRPLSIRKVLHAIDRSGVPYRTMERDCKLAQNRIGKWKTQGALNMDQAFRISYYLDLNFEYIFDETRGIEDPPPRRDDSQVYEILEAAKVHKVTTEEVVNALGIVAAVKLAGLEVDQAIRAIWYTANQREKADFGDPLPSYRPKEGTQKPANPNGHTPKKNSG